MLWNIGVSAGPLESLQRSSVGLCFEPRNEEAVITSREKPPGTRPARRVPRGEVSDEALADHQERFIERTGEGVTPYLARGPNPANFTPRVTQIRSAPRIEIEMPAERPEIPWERLSQTQVPSVCPDAIFSSSARFADPLFGLQRVMTSVRLLTHGRTRSEHKRQR